MKTSFTFLLLLLCSSLFAQPAGSLDLSFGSNGIYQDNIEYYPNKPGRKLVKQLPDGRIIVACIGNYNSGTHQQDFSVFCLNANGTLDNSFGTNGHTFIPFEPEHKNGTTSVDYVTALAIQADGKIVIAGYIYLTSPINNNYYDVGVARVNPNGTIDSTFDGDGRKEIDLRPYSSPGSTCYNADFCTGVVIPANGHIILSGYTTNCSGFQTSYDPFVVQLNANGSFTKRFANGGVQVFATPNTDEIISGSALQANGKLLLMGSTNPVGSGSSSSDILLERMNANGTLDSTFNRTGSTVTDIANGSADDGSAGAVAVLPGGKILVAAMANQSVYMVRYNANGKTDNTFGSNGRVRVDSLKTLTSLSMAPDGKNILTTSDFSVYRYLPDGTRDNTFGTNGYTNLNNSYLTCIGSAVQADGKILGVGTIFLYFPKNQSPYADIVVRFLGNTQTTTHRSAVATKLSINSNKLDIQVYSNPSHDHFNIRVSTNNSTDKINLKVVDLSGKIIEVIPGVQVGQVKELGANYPSGTYIIDVIQGNSHKAVPVMKL